MYLIIETKQTQVARLKEMVEKSNQELDTLRSREQLSQETSKRMQRQLRDAREEITNSEQRDADTSQQVREMQQRIELLESENATLVKDLSLALRRIEDLHVAMQGDMDSSDSDQEILSDERYFCSTCNFLFMKWIWPAMNIDIRKL